MSASLHFHLRDDWRNLKRGRPGHRFQAQYERVCREGPHCGAAKRLATLAVASIALLMGLIMAVIPGPAFPFFIVGGALLATQSRVAARWMDRLELRVRAVGAWLKRHWRRLPLLGRIGVLAVMIGCSGTALFLTYRFLL